MTTTPLTLDQIYQLARQCLQDNGADEANATALASNLTNAERDGSVSHGLFRLPAYVASLRSRKIKGDAKPKVTQATPALIKVHGDNGSAAIAHAVGLPALISSAQAVGVAVGAFTHVHHMSALWHEVETIAEAGLVGFSCTAYLPAVAPHGGSSALFGTNPLSFAWPRPNANPLVVDMATASMAKGEIQIAAREGHEVPANTGLDKAGQPTTDPAAILDGGVILPFGGHKGSGLAMMVELLAAGLLGENFSFEAAQTDNKDGGPPQGGQFILALSPDWIAGAGWQGHCDSFFAKLNAMPALRLPGSRRHQNRQNSGARDINTDLLEKIRALMD